MSYLLVAFFTIFQLFQNNGSIIAPVSKSDTVVLARNKEFKSQIGKSNTVYVVRGNYDLRETKKGVVLKERFNEGNVVYYSNSKPIRLVAGQTLWIPKGCEVFDEDRKQLLCEKGNYTPNGTVSVFVAAKKKKNIQYKINGVATIPEGCTLRFEKGKIYHCVLSFNHTIIEGEENCFNDVMCNGGIIGAADAGWFENKDDKVLQSVFGISDTIFLKAKVVYEQKKTINLTDRRGIRIRGNGATLKLCEESSFQMTMVNCQDWEVDNVTFDVNEKARIGIYGNNSSGGKMVNTCLRNVKDEEATQFGIYGALFYRSSNVRFEKCVVEDIAASSFGVAGGLAFWPHEGVICRNITIKDCKFYRINADTYTEGKGADCIYFGGEYEDNNYVNGDVDNCVFEDFGKRAVKAQAKAVSVRNCRIYDTEKYDFKHMAAIQLFGSESEAINNTIDVKYSSYGISIYAVPRLSVKKGRVAVDENQYIKNVLIRNNDIKMDGNSIVSLGMDDNNVCRYDGVTITGNRFCSKSVLGVIIARGRGKDLTVSDNIMKLEPRDGGPSVAYGMDGIIIYRREATVSFDGKTEKMDCHYDGIKISNNQITGIYRVNDAYRATNNNGIYVEGEGVDIRNNTISNFTRGSSIKGSGKSKVAYKANKVNQTDFGIVAVSDKAEITDNEFQGTRVKDMQVDGKSAVVKRNITSKN